MNRTSATLFTATVGAVVLLAGPAAAGPTTVIQTKLTGAAEVPGPGDPDGKGIGVVKIDRSTGEVCYVLTTHGTEPLLMGHIHEESPGAESGPVVLSLQQVSPTSFKGCAVAPDVAQGLLTHPGEYYLNVHNAEYSGGALRGDLG